MAPKYIVQTVDQARMTREAVVAYKYLIKNRPDMGGDYAPVEGGCVPAKVTVAITAGTTSTAGKGKVKLMDMSDTGSLTLLDIELDCWNNGAAIAVNRVITVAFGMRGVWTLVDACT